MPSARMSESVLEIHLELFGRVFEDMLQEAAISFPSRADIENDRPRLARVAPSGSIASIRPRTFGRIGSPSLSPSLTSPPSRSPSPTSTIASSHTPSSGIRSTAAPHGFDTCVSGRSEGSHHDGPPKLELEEDQVARGREEAVPPPQASTSSSSSPAVSCPRSEAPGERSAGGPGGLPDPQSAVGDSRRAVKRVESAWKVLRGRDHAD